MFLVSEQGDGLRVSPSPALPAAQLLCEGLAASHQARDVVDVLDVAEEHRQVRLSLEDGLNKQLGARVPNKYLGSLAHLHTELLKLVDIHPEL